MVGKESQGICSAGFQQKVYVGAVMKLNHVNVDLGFFLVPGMEFPTTFPRCWFEAKNNKCAPRILRKLNPILTCAYSSKMGGCNRQLVSIFRIDFFSSEINGMIPTANQSRVSIHPYYDFPPPLPKLHRIPWGDWLHRLSGCIIWAQRSRISLSSWFLAMATTSSRPSGEYLPTEKNARKMSTNKSPMKYK